MFPVYLALALFAASCATMQPTASVRDDVYYMPSDPPPAEPIAKNAPADVPAEQNSSDADDYYDPGTAKNYEAPRNYYDMAYNDPYYYNYGRFGFGSGMGMGMGYQTGWNGPGWGMGMGYGAGYPMGSGWSMSMGYGYGSGFYDPWYGGWGNPYMNPWNRPMGYYPYGYYDPYMGGYGAGNYYGPYGNCYSCYTPVVVGGSSGVVVGHRPSVGGSGSSQGSGASVAQPRSSTFRDPVGLTPGTRMDGKVDPTPGSILDFSGDHRTRTFTPRTEPSESRFQIGRTRPDRDNNNRQIERGGSERGGGIDGGDRPSRSGGGGSAPVTSPRPR